MKWSMGTVQAGVSHKGDKLLLTSEDQHFINTTQHKESTQMSYGMPRASAKLRKFQLKSATLHTHRTESRRLGISRTRVSSIPLHQFAG